MTDIPPERIRNFGIIAHIDHGKSTLADRLLELTGCCKNSSTNPILDALPVERERGITVKAQSVSMFYPQDGQTYLLNLIDTPGHADFTNEVARSLTAMQGALLIVDGAAGVQAQTVAHFWRAKEHGVQAILPVINKIDLPQTNIDVCLEQIESQLGLNIYDLPILAISAKTGLNCEKVLPALIKHIPPPSSLSARIDAPFQASLVDCWFKEFRGVICLVSMVRGVLRPGDTIKSVAYDRHFTVDEVGILQPELVKTDYLHAGQIGYIRCGMKSTQDALIGDTFYDPAHHAPPNIRPPKKMKPIVYCGMFPSAREEFEQVMTAVDKLLLNDSSVAAEKIVSVALGPGWRLGFLGSLHMDVFRQRLEQEFAVNVLMTSPNVSYEFVYKSSPSVQHTIGSPEDYPDSTRLPQIKEFREPFVKAIIICPTASFGSISKLCSDARCGQTLVDYLSTDRVKMTVDLPLLEIIGDFNDRLLSMSAGYASFDYEPLPSRPVDLVKIGIRLNGELIDFLGSVQPRMRAEGVARSWVKKLAELLPRQQFAVPVQAVIGSKIIARETVPAMRKDVIAKCVPSLSLSTKSISSQLCSMEETRLER